MNHRDLSNAAAAKGVSAAVLCFAFRTALPVLEEAEAEAPGWRFWERVGARIVLKAMRAYVAHACEPLP